MVGGQTGGADYARGVAGLEDGSCWIIGFSPNEPPGGFLARTTGLNFSTGGTARINNLYAFDVASDLQGRLITAEQSGIVNSVPQNAKISSFTTNHSILWSQAPANPVGAISAEKLALNQKGEVFFAGSLSQFASADFGSFHLTGNPESETLTYYVAKLASAAPAFLIQPRQVSVEVGGNAEMKVSVSGEIPLTYQWFKDGLALQLENASNIVRTAVQEKDDGAYWVVVTNLYGRIESDHVKLTIVTNLPVQVSTLAGNGDAGYLDSKDPNGAKFFGPDGGGVDANGVIFIGDGGNNLVRFITPPNWEVGTLAGSVAGGYREGVGTNALFNGPLGVTVDSVGDVLVADYFGNRLRKIVRGYGATMLLAGNGVEGLVDGFANSVRLNRPNDMVEGPNGEIYFTEFQNHTVRKIDRFGVVSVVAGNGTPGFRDGQGTNAMFNGPAGITLYKSNLYVTDWTNHRVRKVTGDRLVTTVAGSGSAGLKSGVGTAAELNAPNGICADQIGNFYFTEYGNNSVRRMDTNGWVSLLAGGAQGFADGDRTTARFSNPAGICIYPDGSLIVTDSGNNRVRRVVVDGKTNAWLRVGGFVAIDLNPTVKVYGGIGEKYRIEARDRLGQGDWAAVAEIVIDRSPMFWVDERKDGAGQRIYRTVKE